MIHHHQSQPVVIVGAGLAGLCCARQLEKVGIPFLIIEAADRVGGRVRTDCVDGFLLDRGFQVLLTSYPEAQQVLDYHALQLKAFLPGAVVRYGGRFHTLADPWRNPGMAWRSFVSRVGTWADRLRIVRLRARAMSGPWEGTLQHPEMTSREELQRVGFSASMIDQFWRPFLGGIFLDPTLETSSRMFWFVFRMFASGNACLPANGMESIPQQIVSGLKSNAIRLSTAVTDVRPGEVHLQTGETVQASAVVVATDGPQAARWLSGEIRTNGRGVTCLYFAADQSVVNAPILVLNGEGGPINNLCIPTDVAESYGPKGESLVSVSVLGSGKEESQLLQEVRDQLLEWYGPMVRGWRHLRTYSIPYALPDQAPPALTTIERPVRHEYGLYVCGDHRDQASIQGAMVSGRRAAQAICEDLGVKLS